MDLDELGDTAVTVWVARVDCGEETIVTAWSFVDKARAWCEHELECDDEITWSKSEVSTPGKRVTGHYEEHVVATVEQIEIMDPISLSRQYPNEMPRARHVLNDE